jgi:hypothetical protein
MKRMLIIMATVLSVLSVNCGASASLPPPPHPFPPHLAVIVYLVLLDHIIPSNPVSKKTLSPSGETKPNTLVPRVSPARIGLR